MTPQEFIENAPMYTRVEIKTFEPPYSVTRLLSWISDVGAKQRGRKRQKTGPTSATEPFNTNLLVTHVPFVVLATP
jgi:hypothetical protein